MLTFQTASLASLFIHMFGTRPPRKLPLLLLIFRQTKQTISTHHPFSSCCLTPILTSRAGRSVLRFWLGSQTILTVRAHLIMFRISDPPKLVP